MGMSTAQKVDSRTIDCKVVVKNTVNAVTSTTSTTLDMSKLVQPKPLSVLEVITINSTCLFVHWSHDRIFRSKLYRIQYRCLCSWDDTNQSVEVSDPTHSTFLCGLNPAQNYQITAAVRPVQGGFWSEERPGQNVTDEDVPGTEPKTTAGAIISSSCRDSGYRMVEIFWNSIPSSLRHGHEGYIEYQIHYNDSDKNHSLVTEKVWEELDLKCDENYDIRLHAATRVGPSTTYALFQVNPVASMPKPPEEVRVEFVHNSTEKLSVRWTVLPSVERESVSFTVFWCQREYGEDHKKCRSEISWKMVTEMETTIPVAREDAVKYWYGVSMETSWGTSGFYWQQCIYDPLERPKEAPKGFKVSNLQQEETIAVEWNLPPKCNSIKGSAFITGYHLTYCVVDDNNTCTDSPTDKFVAKHQNNFVISNLNSDHKYGILLMAMTEAGNSPQTELVFAKPPPKDITGILEMKITFPIIGFFILAGICIFVFIRCRRMCQRSDKLTEIWAPDIPEQEHHYTSLNRGESLYSTKPESIHKTQSNGPSLTVLGTQVSKDSGISSPCFDGLGESPPFSTNAMTRWPFSVSSQTDSDRITKDDIRPQSPNDNDRITEKNVRPQSLNDVDRIIKENVRPQSLNVVDRIIKENVRPQSTNDVDRIIKEIVGPQSLNDVDRITKEIDTLQSLIDVRPENTNSGIRGQTNVEYVGENIPAVSEPMSSEQMKGRSAEHVSNTSPYVGVNTFNNADDGNPDIGGEQSKSTTNISSYVEGYTLNTAVGQKPDVRGQQPNGSDSLGAASGLNRTNAVSDYVETDTLNTNMTKRETYPGIGPETKSNQDEQSVQLSSDESCASTPTNTSDVSSYVEAYVEASHLNMNSSKGTEKYSEIENNRLEGKVIDGVDENYVLSRGFSKNMYALTTVPKQSPTISPVQETPSAESNTLQSMQNSQGYISPESMTSSATSVEETTPRETVDVESNNPEGTTPSSQLIMNGQKNCDPEIDEDKIAESRRPGSGYILMNQVDESEPSDVPSHSGTKKNSQRVSGYTLMSQVNCDLTSNF
ncbi:hypothetical protein ScPMuIL_005585 [Solemya velum]